MQPKATTGLLAAIVVLLAANLVMQNSTTAGAAGTAQGPTEPYVVQITTSQSNSTINLLRLWSDGAVDQWAINFNGTFWDGWLDLDPVQRADLNADGCVGINDFLILLADWDCES